MPGYGAERDLLRKSQSEKKVRSIKIDVPEEGGEHRVTFEHHPPHDSERFGLGHGPGSELVQHIMDCVSLPGGLKGGNEAKAGEGEHAGYSEHSEAGKPPRR